MNIHIVKANCFIVSQNGCNHNLASLIRRIGSREAITRRFFIIFEYEPFTANRGSEESDAISALTTVVRTAKTYLQQCGNELLVPDNKDEMAAEVFYSCNAVRYQYDGASRT